MSTEHHIEGLLQASQRPHPNDAHRYEGRCRYPFCPGYPRAGLLTLVGTATVCAACIAARASGQMRTMGPCGHEEAATWAKPIVTTNGRRDTVEVCAVCAETFGREMPDRAAFLPMPHTTPGAPARPPTPPVAPAPSLPPPVQTAAQVNDPGPAIILMLTALREMSRPRPGGWTTGALMQRAQRALADLGVR